MLFVISTIILMILKTDEIKISFEGTTFRMTYLGHRKIHQRIRTVTTLRRKPSRSDKRIDLKIQIFDLNTSHEQ